MAEYKIKDIEVLTGIKAHTLRIWEKRYGLPVPSRTDTHIRTYSDQELTLLLNIALLNRNGIKISRIAEMSPKEIVSRVREMAVSGTGDVDIEQLILALVNMDELLFRNTLSALIRQHGLLATYQQYVIPFLERIGVMWQIGSINPAQEHFIANLIRQRLISALEELPVPDASQPKAILFLPEHEWHEMGLLLYHYYLRSHNIPTVYLGQSLPYASLLETIAFVQPKWIITSWITAVDGKYMRRYFERLSNDAPEVLVAVGGFQSVEHGEELTGVVTVFQSIDGLAGIVQ